MNYSFMNKHNFTRRDIEALRDVRVYEYDLKDAGFSILKNNDIFDDQAILKLSSMDKYSKNVAIGKLTRNIPDLGRLILSGLVDARIKFAEINNIMEHDVLSIKKDAIFLIERPDIIGDIGDGLIFTLDHSYTSYYNINKLEFYYDNESNSLDVKGMNQDIVKAHNREGYFLDYMSYLFKTSERLNDRRDLIHFLRREQEKYLNGDLSIHIYKEFNDQLYDKNYIPRFRLKQVDNSSIIYHLDESFDMYFEDIDISYNYINYILPFIQLNL